jgi:uncharacterized protein DUF4186
VRDPNDLFAALAANSFRRRFHLGVRERNYLNEKGLDVVLEHARDFIKRRLAASQPINDGKQTPWRGHPVFIAQHATATCCRGCLSKWHRIEKGRELTTEEQAYVVATIERWLNTELDVERSGA